METFAHIYERAAERKGSADFLEELVSKPLSKQALLQVSDDQWLEEFTRKIFQSGFYWSVINAKWPGFREVFWDFSVEKLLMMPPEMLEEKSSDERIVRNYKKVQTIPSNCYMLYEVANEHGSFSQFLANWPDDNVIGIWAYLKKHGARLGGNTGAYALRALGYDTFVLSRDIEAYCRANDIITGGLQSKRSLEAIQSMFNEFKRQSGRSYQEISQILAYSVGDNVVGMTS